ncbi:MAG TPA: malonyl-ACP O-methyltransferase BioC [Burkholderiales bacterium]|nr:malonyl-ACP O-methyltransferase BioC [Burkholderiales bacterium]
MDDAFSIDKGRVRRSFERAASTCDAAAALQREVGARALSRLELVRLSPAVVVDAGCGTGFATPALRARYPRALVVGIDIAAGMLRVARTRIPAWRRWTRSIRQGFVCADNGRLPLATGTVDMLWSNLAFQWSDDLGAVFSESLRVLRPGGLLTFTTLGPDTLKELRAACAGDGRVHVHRFTDMHDVGDLMVHAGFADPVMDMEYLTLTYPDARSLMHELKACGARNAASGRSRGLTGRKALQAIESGYEAFRQQGRLPATFEIIYGHAWKPLPRIGPGGRPVIDIKPR